MCIINEEFKLDKQKYHHVCTKETGSKNLRITKVHCSLFNLQNLLFAIQCLKCNSILGAWRGGGMGGGVGAVVQNDVLGVIRTETFAR